MEQDQMGCNQIGLHFELHPLILQCLKDFYQEYSQKNNLFLEPIILKTPKAPFQTPQAVHFITITVSFQYFFLTSPPCSGRHKTEAKYIAAIKLKWEVFFFLNKFDIKI
jgi:hypothetical protein